MAYDIGTARGVIEMEYNGRGIDQAKSDLNSLDATGKKAGMSTAEIGQKAGIAGLAIAAGLGAGVAAAASFESRLSAIKAVSGATAGEMDKISAKALQLGKDTSFSAGESAQAMEELIKAGLSVDDVLNGAADATVALAAAGEVDLTTAATIASNAMNQFGLSAKDMTGVVDNIAGAANASAIDVNDFGQSLTQVGAVANLAGVSFKDTATAIALMGNAGIKGSDAGTSLKTMFMRLQPTTDAQYETMTRLGMITFDANKAMEVLAQNGIKNVEGGTKGARDAMMQLAADLTDSEVGSAKAEKKFKELGLQTGALRNQFYDANGELKSMSQISEILQSSLSGMTKQQQQATLQTLFGSDAIRGAAVLANAGAEGFDKMAESMGKVSAAEVAATRLDNFKGSLEALKGSLETMGIAIGMVLLPALRQVVDFIAMLANAFLKLPAGAQQTIVVLAAVAAGILLAVAAIIKIMAFIQAFQAVLVTLRAVMATTWIAALGPIALVIAAIAAIGAAIFLLWKNSETFRDIVMAVWNAIKVAISAVAQWFMGTIVPSLVTAYNTIKTGISAVGTVFSTVWNAIKTVVGAVIGFITGLVKAQIAAWLTIFKTGLNAIQAVWKAVWGLFGPLVKAVWNLITTIIKVALHLITSLIKAQWNLIKSVTSTVWNAIKTVIQNVWGVIKKVAQTGATAVRTVVGAAWNAVKAVTSTIWNAIMGVIRAIWGRIGDTVMNAVNRVKDMVSRAWEVVKNSTERVWNGLAGGVRQGINTLMDAVGSLRGRVTGYFSDAYNWIKTAGYNMIVGLAQGIYDAVGVVTGAVNHVTSVIKSFLPGSPVKQGPLKILNRGRAGKEIMQMVIDGLVDMTGPIERVVGGIADTMASNLAGPPVQSVTATVRPTTGAEKVVPRDDPPPPPLIGTQNVWYPQAEPASQAAARQRTRSAALGRVG